jgi:hypothetical protein
LSSLNNENLQKKEGAVSTLKKKKNEKLFHSTCDKLFQKLLYPVTITCMENPHGNIRPCLPFSLEIA